ncbi:MAG: hypothetical protein US31_C0011G0029 [Berkelbacteria bacterium GW2011_GWA1_36_9]|uniref:Transcriptional repressor PaaX-like central Cas2-like domain-containing protein n=1 Tax=Berkelbacteria bacterium GW2011_GWA1_36_9 TaxID=1618331 RepID=A0A0G0FJM8_9BACT|nr:MAG: hypothetical protein US31_C0011G0029 [Berkelbacteria bacterium GW2011_GWA1_36_9]
MKRKKPIIGENEKEIIKCVGLGLFVVASIVLPNLPMALQPIFKMRGNKGLQKLLKNLEKKRYINLGSEKIKLTSKGKELLQKIYISEITISKPKEWDGNWHLIAYDIPEIYRNYRDDFREFLERNNFYQTQKSLWVYPYECKEEIAVICKNLNILPYVIVMTTEKLPNEEKMVAHFGLDN